MTPRCDVLIIGAGIMGSSIAFELSKKGYRTLNIDRLSEAGMGSTANTCAIIRTTYSTLEGTALAWDSTHTWKNWEAHLETTDERGPARFNNTGFLIMKPHGYDWNAYLDIHDTLSIPYEIWDRKRLLKELPHFVDDSFYPPRHPDDPLFGQDHKKKLCDQVLFFPEGGYINDPVLSVHNLQRAAENKGGRFIFGKKVQHLITSGDDVSGAILYDGTKIYAPVVVNASGPHSAVINRMAGIENRMRIKTRPLRHEVHFVPSPEIFTYKKDVMVISDGDLAGYHRPETGDQILVGSEDPACDEPDWIDDPDNFNRDITEDQYRAQVFRLAQRMPSLPIPNNRNGVVDLYDVSDDWTPIYDSSDLRGFYLCIGTSGNQYKNGPAVGHLMAELIDRCENGQDHDGDPVHVTLKNIDYRLNTKIFSRNREINKNSTFSVLG